MSSSDVLTLRQLNRATLARQLVLKRHSMTPLAALERLVGLQAQLARPPFLGLWTRLETFQRQALLTLLRRRKVVRATLMRGTLHLMSARDFVRLRAPLTASIVRAFDVLGPRGRALDLPALTRTGAAFFEDEPATFQALRTHLATRFQGDLRAMAYAIRLRVPLVQVVTDDRWGFGADPSFALAEAWLGERLAESDAVDTLVLRYLAAFGPASVTDAQTWSGLRGLGATFDKLRPRLETFRDERKRELFDVARAPLPDEDTDAPVRLLPDFDNLLLGHQDRRRIIADAHRGQVFTRNLQVRPTFLIDGFVAGTWKVERKRAIAALVLTPFKTVPKPVRSQLEAEAEGAIRFLEEDAQEHEVRFARPA